MTKTWPADRLKTCAISSLVPYANNARTHTEAQVAQIAASIREFGFTNPVLTDGAGGIIAGHGRVLAAHRLGMTEVPTISLGYLTDAQRRAYVIADNRLALDAGWDFEMLKLELDNLTDLDFDLSLTGFTDDEIASITAERTTGLTDPDDVPDLPSNPVANLADVWILGRHRLVCGDCTDADIVAKCLNGVTPHLMATDPPYGVAYDPSWRARAGVNLNRAKLGKVANDDRADWSEAWALFPGNIAYVWHGGLHAATVEASLTNSGFAIRSQIIWVKDRFALSRGDYHWQHEPCWYAVRGTGNWAGDRKQTTVWNIAAREDRGHGHGTQKPVECMKRPIEHNSSAGQAVYEPFSGSGTTIIACEMTGRSCHAIELSPAYVDVAIQRWQTFSGQQATRNGESYAEIAARREVV